jgi:hypothetical protein
MSDLTLYTGAGALTRDSRRTGRAISRVHSESQVRQAVIDAEVDVTIAKLDAVTNTTGHAMTGVGRVGQLETALAQSFPAGTGRVAFLADGHMLDSSDLLHDLARRVRQI